MPEDNPSVRRGGGGGLTVASSHVSVQKSEHHATDLHLEDTEAPDFWVGRLGCSLLRAWPQEPAPDRKERCSQGSVAGLTPDN